MNQNDNFPYAMDLIFMHEGGLSDDKHDKGGLTNFGITLPFLRQYNPNATIDDIPKLTKTDAEKIYKFLLWDKYNYSQIHDKNIAAKIFDMSVNIGEYESHKIAQISINSLLKNQITVDGILGPISIEKLNDLNPDYLMNELRQHLKNYYLLVVAKNPDDRDFLNGWLNRAAW